MGDRLWAWLLPRKSKQRKKDMLGEYRKKKTMEKGQAPAGTVGAIGHQRKV
jgi:hypothetical protein